jgi:hypothetical protein
MIAIEKTFHRVVKAAAGLDPYQVVRYTAIIHLVQEWTAYSQTHLSWWNDTPTRTMSIAKLNGRYRG